MAHIEMDNIESWLQQRQERADKARLNVAISLLREHRLADSWPLNDIIVQLGQVQDGIYGQES